MLDASILQHERRSPQKLQVDAPNLEGKQPVICTLMWQCIPAQHFVHIQRRRRTRQGRTLLEMRSFARVALLDMALLLLSSSPF